MGITGINDIIVPEVFIPYVTKRTMELSALLNSGIVENNKEFDKLASESGNLINMPYFNDLTGDAQVIGEGVELIPDGINANKDVAIKQGRAKQWGVNNLASYLSGADPARAIGDLAAEYWSRQYQSVLLHVLVGIFNSPSMSGKVLDISAKTDGAALISGESFIDANQLMGDAKSALTGVMMHSAVESYLAKLNLIEYVQLQNQDVRVPYFMNKQVIVDDTMFFDTTEKVGEAYLFGKGAVALGNGKHESILEVETSRNSNSTAGEDFLTNRKIFMLHPRGVRWEDAERAKTFPSNYELSRGSNWGRVYDDKAVRIVKFKFKIK